MRLIKSRYLDDGKLFNKGQEATLVQIEDSSDYDQLERNIQDTGYYNGDYFKRNIGHNDDLIKYSNLALAALAMSFNPVNVVDMGCGRGEVLHLLGMAGVEGLQGLDISSDAQKMAHPDVAAQIAVGPPLESCRRLAAQGRKFDLCLGLDFWEHLHPDKLSEHLEVYKTIAAEDAFFLFVVPAFGHDEVFGELFPLEFEENRPEYDVKGIMSYLLAEVEKPPIPSKGHLIWAHTQWWQNSFAQSGLVRCRGLETMLHRLLDTYLTRAQQGFYVLRMENSAAASKVAFLESLELGHLDAWRLILHMCRSVQRRGNELGCKLMDGMRLQATVDDATYRLFQRFQKAANDIEYMRTRPNLFRRLLNRIVGK